MKVLIDTNIILDWLQKREPFFSEAYHIMRQCLSKSDLEGYVSSHSLCDVFFILRKEFSSENRFQLIHFLSSHFNVIAETQEDFIRVTTDPTAKDLEDGLQMVCAEKEHLDYIITRNLEDYMCSEVPAISPKDFYRLAR
ncbi:MAG: PIN domain-containing protein [Victivallales bacterium]|nr:PIN domain-containing protein [Victivallales bacterium]